MSARDDAHRLVDAVPDDHVPMVVELLREFTHSAQAPPAGRRQFRTVGVFDGEPDLGGRAKDIARREIGGEAGMTA